MDSSTRTQQQPPKPRRLVDNVAEVRRRKEAAERLIRERHEALRRQHEEKIMKINEERQRQQRELKERHAKELKRQQDVLQRRMALMERDNARKKEILEKNHAVVSRLANNSSRKNYAFGSSTPRELSFLEGRHLKNTVQEKRSSPEKQNSNGSVNAPPRRSVPAVMSSSMYVPSTPDRGRQTSSVTRLAQPKTTPTKQQNLMTQSVYSQLTNSCVTPVSRLQRKPLSQLTASVPNTPLSSGTQSDKMKKQQPKPKPRGVPLSSGSKRQTSTSKLSKSVSELARKESLHSNDTHSSIGARTTESPLLDGSSTSDEVPQEMPDVEAHKEVDVLQVEPQHVDVVQQNGDGPQNSELEEAVVGQTIPSDDMHTSVDHQPEQASEEESMHKAVHEENEADGSPAVAELVAISEVVDANSVTSGIAEEDIASAPSVEKGGASLADELAGIFDAPLPPSPIPVVVDDITEEVPPPQPVESFDLENRKQLTPEAPKSEASAEEPVKNHAVNGRAEEETTDEVFVESPEVIHVTGSTPADKDAEAVAEGSEKDHVESGTSENKVLEEASTTGTPQESKHTSADKSLGGTLKQPAEMLEEQSVVSPPENVVDTPPKAAADSTVNEAQTNGIQKQPPPVIAELPGTVPPTKETDDSIVKKIPSPPNEFIAHRLRREQEQRELDERKARIAAILAKSRNLSNAATPLVAGRTSPPRSESAQDVLKRLASNGNLPALQKLVARHASETAAIEQFSAPEDPAPQAI